jgi:hypothetical protein
MALTLGEAGVRIGEETVDVSRRLDAARRLRTLLGPVASVHAFEGVGRTAFALAAGVILLVQDSSDELLSLFVCFNAAEAHPFPGLSEVPTFTGEVECGRHRFSGGEPERQILGEAGISGLAGVYVMDLGHLRVGLTFKRSRNRLGTKAGQRRLVVLDAAWGGLRPFPQQERTGPVSGAGRRQ